MKRLRKKSGFTLVECVVAMAILAIMTLMLAMMMQAIVGLRNYNRDMEEGIDNQVANLMDESGLTSEKLDGGDIVFDNGEKIPGDKANKVYFSDAKGNAQIGGLDYGIEDVNIETDPSEDPDKEDEDDEEENKSTSSRKVYGAVGTTGNSVQITEKKDELKDGIHTIEWEVSFIANDSSNIKSLKVAFPFGAHLISYTQSNCYVHCLGNRVVRLQPTNDTNEWYTQSVTATIEFTISDSDYVYEEEISGTDTTETKKESFKHYFTGVGTGGNSVILYKQTTGKHAGEFMSNDDPRRNEK